MELLERLTQTPAIAGREHRLRDLILKETKDLFDETRVDPLGSLICVRHARPAIRVEQQPVHVRFADIDVRTVLMPQNGELRSQPLAQLVHA